MSNGLETAYQTNKKTKKKKFLPKRLVIIIFIICQIIFIPIFSVCLAYYGPFEKIKETLVTTAMTTLSHKYLATWFLPQEEIDRILAKNSITIPTDNQNLDGINISGKKSDTVEIIDIQEKNLIGKLMIVHDPSRVHIGTAPDLGQAGATLSQIVKSYNCAGGVNAGGFADDKMAGNGGTPVGIIIENGEIKHGESLQGEMDLVGFNKNNVLVVKTELTVTQIKKLNIRDGISFGPPLVINSNPVIKDGDGGWGIAPRTAIGQKDDGSVLLLTMDGRSIDTLGATLKQVQDILIKYGAVNAANLDGGSSTTMVYDGKVVNTPSNTLGERSIPNAFIVK